MDTLIALKPNTRQLKMLISSNKLISVFLLSALIFSQSPLLASTQRNSSLQLFRNQIYEAYVLNNMPQWARTLNEMEAAYEAQPSPELLYDLLLAQYGIIGYYLGNNKESMGEAILQRAEELRRILERTQGFQAQAHAFESAFIAFRISLNPLQALVLGPRSSNAVNRAERLNPQYPRVWVEKGNIMFFAPAPFGNKRNAISYYQQAVMLMHNQMHPSHRWLYLSTLVSLANSYEKTGNIEMAIQTVNTALRFEPRFRWAKEDLLPKLQSLQ